MRGGNSLTGSLGFLILLILTYQVLSFISGGHLPFEVGRNPGFQPPQVPIANPSGYPPIYELFGPTRSPGMCPTRTSTALQMT